VNSTEKADANFLVTFPEKVTDGTVFIGDHSSNLTVRAPVVTSSTVTCVSSPCPDGTVVADIGLDTNLLQGNLVMSDGRPLEATNATTEARFSVDLVVQNFSAPLAIGTGHNATWSKQQLNSTHTRYVFNVTASEYDYLRGASIDSWPTGSADVATNHSNASVSVAFDPMTQYGASDQERDQLDGTVIMTDAQTFSQLEYQTGATSEPASLSLRVAGPHFEPDGETVNDGYYEAFLPNSLLSSWDVDDPASLEAAYQGSDSTLTAENQSGGIFVDIPIHYSTGTVQIEPGTSPSSDSTDSDTPGDTSPNTGDESTASTSDTSGTSSDSTSGGPSSSSSDSENDNDGEDSSAVSGTESESVNTTEVPTGTPISEATTSTTTESVPATTSRTPATTSTQTLGSQETEQTAEANGQETAAPSEATETSGPGFGSLATLTALLALVVLAVRRQ